MEMEENTEMVKKRGKRVRKVKREKTIGLRPATPDDVKLMKAYDEINECKKESFGLKSEFKYTDQKEMAAYFTGQTRAFARACKVLKKLFPELES